MAEVPEIGLDLQQGHRQAGRACPDRQRQRQAPGPPPVRGGRAGPRAILFLIARIAARYDPHLAAFHDRLQKAGKEKMVIRIALARKLLVILNAKARDTRNEFANAT